MRAASLSTTRAEVPSTVLGDRGTAGHRHKGVLVVGARGVDVGRDGQPVQFGVKSRAENVAPDVLDEDAIVIDLTVPGEVAIELPSVNGTDVVNGLAVDGVPIVRRLPENTPTGLLGATPIQLGLKRMVDVTFAGLALLVLSPLLAVVAVLVKLSSPGPIFFRATRVGRDGETFEFWKFRSMYEGAEKDRWSFEHRNEATGPVFKIPDDPRCTKVGRALRRSSLDELPQLFHVVSGKMSLVGPRPPLPEEVAEYDDHALRRLAVRPGITCIWQTSGRSEIGFDTWVDMDIEYIDSWTLGKDFGLMMRTIPAVLGGRGAY